MRLLLGHDQDVWQWANRFFECPLTPPTWAIGVIDNSGLLRGAALGEERNKTTSEITICSDGDAITPALAREFLQAIFARYWRLEVRTTKDNKSVKRNAIKWGFAFEGSATDYWGPGRAALLYRMLKSDCRWIRTGNGKCT